MKRNFKLLSVLAIASTIITTSGVAMAAEGAYGSTSASADTSYTLSEMLTYAIQDEYMAQAEYDAIMDQYGVQRPFSNIIRAEAYHIELLQPLFETYDVALPVNDSASKTIVPETLEEAYAVGVDAEVKNIAMYESFLKEDLPADVEAVFTDLMEASEKHLTSFERKVDGNTGYGSGRIGSETGNGQMSGSGRGNGGMSGGRGHGGNGSGTGTGIGNGGTSADCIVE